MTSRRKISIVLPSTLLYRLRQIAQNNKTTLSALVQTLLEDALFREKRVNLEITYAALNKVAGCCKASVKDASTTINEVLYGENGAWRGRDAE